MLSINFVHGARQGFHLVNIFFNLLEVVSPFNIENRPLQVSESFDSSRHLIEVMFVVHLINWTHQIFHTLEAEVNFCIVMLSVNGIVWPLQVGVTIMFMMT